MPWDAESEYLYKRRNTEEYERSLCEDPDFDPILVGIIVGAATLLILGAAIVLIF